MTKESLLRLLVAVAAATTTISAFVPGIAAFIPPDLALALTAGLLAIKEIIVVIGDYIDNGKRDGSFTGLLMLLLALGAALAIMGTGLVGCAAVDRVIAIDPIEDAATGVSYLPNTKQPGGKLVITQASWDVLRVLIAAKWPGVLPTQVGADTDFGAALVEFWQLDELPDVTEILILPN